MKEALNFLDTLATASIAFLYPSSHLPSPTFLISGSFKFSDHDYILIDIKI
jgi:hypothetical protein